MDVGQPTEADKEQVKTNQAAAASRGESIFFTPPPPDEKPVSAAPSFSGSPTTPPASPPAATPVTPPPPSSAGTPVTPAAPAAPKGPDPSISTASDMNIPINNTPTAKPEDEPLTPDLGQSEMGVGKPDIGVEKESTTEKPAADPVTPPINQPVSPPIMPETSPAKEESSTGLAPDATPGSAPEPTASGAVEVPINKYSNNIVTDEIAPQNTSPNTPAAQTNPAFVNTPKPPVKASKTGSLVAVMAFLALVVGAGGGFFGFKYLDKVKSSADSLGVASTSSTDSSETSTTSQTKDYTSTKYGFSLKYPSDWFTSTADTQATSLVLASNQESLEGTATGYKVAVEFQDNDGKTLKAWVDAYKTSTGETAEPTQLTVSSSPAYQQKISKNGQATNTYVPLSDKIMILTYTAPEGKFTTGEEFYNQIIASIKVTE